MFLDTDVFAMKCSALVSVAFALMFAMDATGATLTVAADQTTYGVGDTITLTVVGTTNPFSENATGIDVRLDLPLNISFVSSTADIAQTPPCTFGPCIWTVGETEGTLSGSSLTVFNQIQGPPPGGPFVNNSNGVDTAFVTATVVLTATSSGLASFAFGPLTNFFGLGAALGGSTPPGTIVNIVPEPTMATLMALGLLGLAMRRRV